MDCSETWQFLTLQSQVFPPSRLHHTLLPSALLPPELVKWRLRWTSKEQRREWRKWWRRERQTWRRNPQRCPSGWMMMIYPPWCETEPLHVSSKSRSPTLTTFMCCTHDLKVEVENLCVLLVYTAMAAGFWYTLTLECNITTAVCRPRLSSLSLCSVIVLGWADEWFLCLRRPRKCVCDSGWASASLHVFKAR